MKQLTPEAGADGLYKFSAFKNAKELGDDIEIAVYDKEGKLATLSNASAVNKKLKYNIRDNYINSDYIQNGNSADLKELVKAIDNYGYWSQKYFGYKVENVPENLSNEGATLSSLTAADMANVGSLPEGVEFVGTSLLLKDTITMRYYFSGDFSDSIRIDGDVVQPMKKGEFWYIEKPEILPTDLAVKNRVTIGDYSLAASVNSYIKKADSSTSNEILKNLMQALTIYGDRANAYVNSR